MKKDNPGSKANRNILRLTYVISALFLCLCAYFAWFLQVRSESVINNSYNNARMDSFADRIVRGKILGNDGSVLAETVTDENGTERRSYPYGPLFSHAVGYSTKGKTGLESQANFYLWRSHVNLMEQTVNELTGVKNPGDSVVTTLDVRLQQTASDALGDRRGAVVVMEPDTGKILAMVSKPSFDPNTLEENWDNLISPENTSAQLLNRAAQGLYPPGSTFKIVTALEYIREHPGDFQDYHFDCNGYFHLDNYTIKCYHETAHGSQDLGLAFANSCNGAFANLGLGLDLGKLNSLTGELLFGKDLPLPFAYNKSSFTMNNGADTWTVLQTSIGQGETQITPIHNLLLTAAIANGGTLMKPYLIDSVENAGGEEIKKFMPSSYGSLMSAGEAQTLTNLMRGVVTDGTGSAVRTDAYTVAGKTGSAEFETGKETHAWFVGFAPAETPKIAVSVIVEEGGSGGKVAGPVARSIFDAYFMNN